jgi:hypothetical protein
MAAYLARRCTDAPLREIATDLVSPEADHQCLAQPTDFL